MTQVKSLTDNPVVGRTAGLFSSLPSLLGEYLKDNEMLEAGDPLINLDPHRLGLDMYNKLDAVYKSSYYAGLHILLDADLLVYRAGFSSSKDMADWGIVRSRMENMAEAIWNDLHEFLGLPKPPSTMTMFLTGCKKIPNFREEVAPYYKANRTETSKPPYYQELRDAIEDRYYTVVTEGVEADDYFGQAIKDSLERAPHLLPVVVSIDKDLLMIPGLHYHFVNKEFNMVDSFDGLYQFFTQMLTGDSADNIPGLKRYGPKKAEKVLKNASTAEDMFLATANEYIKMHGEQNWQHEWDVHCDLLWILRTLDAACPYRTDCSAYSVYKSGLLDEALWQEKQEEGQANP